MSSATSRLLVQEKIYDEVMDNILDRAASISVGSPLRSEDKKGSGGFMGPLISGPQRDKVIGFIERVSERGGRRWWSRSA